MPRYPRVFEVLPELAVLLLVSCSVPVKGTTTQIHTYVKKSSKRCAVFYRNNSSTLGRTSLQAVPARACPNIWIKSDPAPKLLQYWASVSSTSYNHEGVLNQKILHINWHQFFAHIMAKEVSANYFHTNYSQSDKCQKWERIGLNCFHLQGKKYVSPFGICLLKSTTDTDQF